MTNREIVKLASIRVESTMEKAALAAVAKGLGGRLATKWLSPLVSLANRGLPRGGTTFMHDWMSAAQRAATAGARSKTGLPGFINTVGRPVTSLLGPKGLGIMGAGKVYGDVRSGMGRTQGWHEGATTAVDAIAKLPWYQRLGFSFNPMGFAKTTLDALDAKKRLGWLQRSGLGYAVGNLNTMSPADILQRLSAGRANEAVARGMQ